MDQPTDRAIPARPDHQQVKGSAVEREFLGGVALHCAGLNPAECRDPFPCLVHQRVDRVAQAEQARLEPAGCEGDGLEGGEL